MKKKELNKLREKSIKQLQTLVDKKKLELVKIQSKMKVGKEKNLKSTKNLKRDVAQILTIIREKELIKKASEISKVPKISKRT